MGVPSGEVKRPFGFVLSLKTLILHCSFEFNYICGWPVVLLLPASLRAEKSVRRQHLRLRIAGASCVAVDDHSGCCAQLCLTTVAVS